MTPRSDDGRVMTGVPDFAFVEGAICVTFVTPDIAALPTESVPAIGAGHGTASSVAGATDRHARADEGSTETR